jgi:hypothetical protein
MSEHVSPPVKVSFIIDGVVVENMGTDERLGAIFMSNPVIVESTGINVAVGDLYDETTGKFTREIN